MVTTILRSVNLSKACDAVEFDAECLYSVNLVARKPEKRTTDQQLRAEVSDELAMAS